MVKPFGGSHWARWAGSAHMAKTRSRGASEGAVDDEFVFAGAFLLEVFGEAVPGGVAGGLLDVFWSARRLRGGEGHGHVHGGFARPSRGRGR